MSVEVNSQRNNEKPAPTDTVEIQVMENQSQIQNQSMVVKDPQHTIRLDFSNICLDVNTKTGKKRILNNVSGYVKPGEILYIMGPSGSGKTTLLDYLTNRTFQSPKDNVYLNHQRWNEPEFKKVARYCQQTPQLYEIFTVYETLEYAASFFTKDKKSRQKRVNETITMLGLDNQKNTRIGGILFRGISGGQKQRVSVGEQLVADPALLFLDEPTSGLDSAAAYKLMYKLKQIAIKKQITVIASIHQPSQRVFDLSDRLIFLAGGLNFGGNTAYFGKTQQIQAHFAELGLKNTSNSSLSEWILDEVNADFGDATNIKNIIEKFKTTTAYKTLQEEQKFVKEAEQKLQKIDNFQFLGAFEKQSILKDIITLITRGVQNNLKNPLALAIRIMTYSTMAVIIGSCWLSSANEPTAADVQNIAGVLFFMASFMSIMSVSLIPVYIEDKQIMIKEKSNGCYKFVSYQFSNFVVGLPFTFLLALTSGAICFFMVQFDNSGGSFMQFVLDLFVTLIASEAIVLCVSYMFSHLLVCIILVSLILCTFMVMNGFFLKKDDIPDYWIWIHYLAFNTYSFKNFMHNAFSGITIHKDLSLSPPALEDYPGELVLKGWGLDGVNSGENVFIILLFSLGFRLYALIWSYFKHTGKK